MNFVCTFLHLSVGGRGGLGFLILGLKVVDQNDDRAIVNLAADLTWQIAGVVVSPMIMSVAEFEAWKASERRTPLAIEREGIPL